MKNFIALNEFPYIYTLSYVECFKYLGSIITNDGKCTCEIKSRIAMTKDAFNKADC